MSDLNEIARDLAIIAEKEKEIKKSRAALKTDFLDLIDEEHAQEEHLLPVRTIEVPLEFFDKTGLGELDFLETRFPGWEVEHAEVIDDSKIYILKKSVRYLAKVVEQDWSGKTLKVSKEVAEFTPEIDWETLQAEFPSLIDAISTPVLTRQLDEQKFAEELERNPALLHTLQRHMRVKEPVIRVTPRVEKKDG